MSKAKNNSTVEPFQEKQCFPRDTSEYRASDDFLRAKKNRNIHGWIIREVIENGRLVQDPQDGIRQFRRIIDGYEWKFVVAYNENEKNTVVTGYIPELPDDKTTQRMQYKEAFPK